jgi:hypothetical protein
MATADKLRSMKARGWVALVAGVFLVVLMGGIWIYLANAIADHRMTMNTPGSRAFMGQVFVAFALLIASGFVGIASGIHQIRTGTRNRALLVVMVLLVLSAVGTIVFATSTERN